MVVPVIVLTVVVLIGILAIFRKYLALRDRLDAEMLRGQRGAAEKPASRPKPAADFAVLVQTRRHAA